MAQGIYDPYAVEGKISAHALKPYEVDSLPLAGKYCSWKFSLQQEPRCLQGCKHRIDTSGKGLACRELPLHDCPPFTVAASSTLHTGEQL